MVAHCTDYKPPTHPHVMFFGLLKQSSDVYIRCSGPVNVIMGRYSIDSVLSSSKPESPFCDVIETWRTRHYLGCTYALHFLLPIIALVNCFAPGLTNSRWEHRGRFYHAVLFWGTRFGRDAHVFGFQDISGRVSSWQDVIMENMLCSLLTVCTSLGWKTRTSK